MTHPLQKLFIALVLAVSAFLPAALLWWIAAESALAPFMASLDGVQSQFMAVMSVLFSLNLVFVCNEIWQNRDAAQTAIAKESEALRNIGRLASNMNDCGGTPILIAARRYAQTVIDKDFPELMDGAKGEALGSESLEAVIDLSNAVLADDALDKLNPSSRSLLVSQLTIVRDRRLERLSISSKRFNRVKWVSLLLLEAMALLSIALAHATDPTALFVTCFVFLCAVNPFIVALYYSRLPFAGLDPLKGAPLRAALARLQRMEAVYRKGGKAFGGA